MAKSIRCVLIRALGTVLLLTAAACGGSSSTIPDPSGPAQWDEAQWDDASWEP